MDSKSVMIHLRIAVLLPKKKKNRQKQIYLIKVVVSNINIIILSLLFERRWIPHMLGAALHKIMYRQPLP